MLGIVGLDSKTSTFSASKFNAKQGREVPKHPINFHNFHGKCASKAQKESMKKQKRRATTYFGIAEMDRSSYVCGFKRLYATNVLCVDC